MIILGWITASCENNISCSDCVVRDLIFALNKQTCDDFKTSCPGIARQTDVSA